MAEYQVGTGFDDILSGRPPAALRALALAPSAVVDADGTEVEPLDLKREWNELARAIGGQPVRLEVLWPAALAHLERVLADAAAPWHRVPYAAVYVSCHGLPGLVLLDDSHGRGVRVSGEKLGQVLGKYDVKLVVLGACHSAEGQPGARASPSAGAPGGAEAQAGSVAQGLLQAGVKAVVAAVDSVEDRLAADFAAQLLAMVGRGDKVGKAFESAVRALPSTEGRAQWRLYGEAELVLDTVEVKPGFSPPPPDPPGVEPCSHFLDRAAELVALSELLDFGQEPVIWVGGEGGLGKTVLAGELARRNAWRFPGGVVWVAFDRSPPTLESVLQAAEQARLKPEGGTLEERGQKLAALASTVGRPALFILDNLDTVLEAADEGNPEATAVVQWLSQVTPPARVLVTSREDPRLGAVQASPELGAFPLKASVDLFWRAAGGAQPGLDPKNSECRRLVTEICRSLGGLILAVELVGSAARDADLKTVRDDLEKELEAARLRKISERHRSLKAALAHSFAALERRSSVNEQAQQQAKEVLPILAVFPGGAGPPMLDSVLGNGNWEYGLRALTSLSVARTAEAEGRSRWYLLPPVRQFALGRVEAAVAQRTRRKGMQYLTGLKTPDHNDAANAAAAVAWLDKLGDSRERFEFAEQVGTRLHERGFWSEAEPLLRAALDLAEQVRDPRLVAISARNLGNLARERGELQEAEQLYRQSLKISKGLSDRSGVAETLLGLGNLARGRGELQKAERLYRQSLNISEELGDHSRVANTLSNLGILARRRGELKKAEQLYEQSVTISRKLDDQSSAADTLNNWGTLARRRGEFQKAEDLYRQSLGIKEELSDRSGMAHALIGLGELAQARGELREAEQFYRQSLRIKEELGDRSWMALCLHDLGEVAQERGRLGEAEQLYREGLGTFRRLGDRLRAAMALRQLGRLARELPDLGCAKHLYDDSLKTFRELGERLEIADTLLCMGELARDQGSLEVAHRLVQEGLEMARSLGLRPKIATALHHLGALALDRGAFGEAERLFRQALIIREQLGARIGIAVTLHQLGELALTQLDGSSAEDYFQQSLAISLKVGTARAALRTYEGLARTAHAQGDEAKRRRYLDEAAAYARSQGPEVEEYWNQILEHPPGPPPSRP